MRGPSLALPAAIRLHRCHLDDDRDIDLAAAGESLSAPERARSVRFVHRRDGERYIRGRGFLRRVLGAELGVAAATVALESPPGAKPCVPGAPFDFNLSHSAGSAVLAVSTSGPVGIDLELRNGPTRSWDNLASTGRLCFTDPEMEALEALAGERRIARFLAFWTAKEARMKLLGHGMAMHPRSIHLRLSGGEPTGFRDDPEAAILHRVETGLPEAVCHLACLPADPMGRPG